MAPLRGVLTSEAKSGRTGETSRLSHFRLRAKLATWHTEVYACVDADGSVVLTVRRDGVLLHDYKADPEA
jgi:hypothetical protein